MKNEQEKEPEEEEKWGPHEPAIMRWSPAFRIIILLMAGFLAWILVYEAGGFIWNLLSIGTFSF